MISPPRRRPALMTAAPENVSALLADLGRIDRLLRQQVERLRVENPAASDDQFRGLYVSDAEVDAILEGQWPMGPDGHEAPAPEAPITHAPLRLLAERFRLDAFEVAVVLICLAPEISLSYERLFAYLQDDVTRKRPSIDLVLNLLCPSVAQKLVAWRRLAPDAPLLARGLLVLSDDQPGRHGPRLASFLNVDDRVVEFLLGADELDPRLAGSAHLHPPSPDAAPPLMADEPLARLEMLARHALAAGDEAPLLCLHGPRGVGREAAATAVCARLGLPLLSVDLPALLTSEEDAGPTARRLVREARLLGAALYLNGAEALAAEEKPALLARRGLAAALAPFPGLCLLSVTDDAPVLDQVLPRRLVPIDFEPLTHAARLALWQRRAPASLSAEALDELAGRFRLNAGQIIAASHRATSVAMGRDPVAPTVILADLFAASRRQGTPKLGSLARKVTARFGWDDIVLPPDQKAQLSEMIGQMRYRDRVLETWGFDRTVSRGKGLNALFSGPSGSGKTMAAEVMARELGIEMYKVDLSSMVSKYIGETEKNLERLFSEAEQTSAILFFDEADAIFGKRSEVKDAHDRYANIEVGYLLQRIEEYNGVVILATNLRKNMDDAFVRRLHMSIEFPFPEEEDRLVIWRLAFPASAPLADDVDLPFLARRFKLTGGNIKNIALAAAFLAATDGTLIRMAHLIRGTRREYQKLGKLVVESEFGPYFSLLKG